MWTLKPKNKMCRSKDFKLFSERNLFTKAAFKEKYRRKQYCEI